MDITLARSIITVVSFGVFIVICWWAWSNVNRERFAEAAQLPLEDDGATSLNKISKDAHHE
jgi:cytochrome c oxidase cbb3-type subunit IV